MTEPETASRHASRLELFFDLVVVVAVNQLATLLHGDAHHGPGGLAITTFFALYLAIWPLWTTFTLCSNVAADKVQVRAVFVGVAGIATMAAAVPHSTDGRANVFASRVDGGEVLARTNQAMAQRAERGSRRREPRRREPSRREARPTSVVAAQLDAEHLGSGSACS